MQPNAPQSEKWDENLAPVFFNRMIEATEQANDVNLIVWPESAIYKPLNYADDLLDAINEASSGVPVYLGHFVMMKMETYVIHYIKQKHR